jgi:hypothetical protein
MSSYSFPPFFQFHQVLQNCPKAGLTYLNLWQNKNKENCLYVTKTDIRNEYLSSLSKFRHDILLLVREGVISVNETPEKIYIDLLDWDELDQEGYALC